MKRVLGKIAEKFKKTPTIQVFNDLYYMCLETKKTDILLAIEYLMFLSDECEKAIASGALDVRELFHLHKKVLLAGA